MQPQWGEVANANGIPLLWPLRAPPCTLSLPRLSADGQALKVFNAHSAGIISMAQAGTRTYTLAADGSIKGWSSALPDEADADVL